MEKIKVGIIGAGSISHFHTRAYQKLENVEVVAVCDLNEERAKAYAKEYHIPHVFTNHHDMLQMEDLDAVSVTTWNNGHAPISIDALKAGKHVLCEKPLAMNAKEAEEMVKVSKETGKLLMVGFVRRFGENTKLLKEAIEQNQLGDVYYAKTGCIRRWGNPGGWFSDWKRSGGGPVIDLGVHMIDLVRYLNGKPKAVSVSASTFNQLGMKPDVKGMVKYYSADYSTHNDVEDGATALIKFENGLTLFFETSWVMHVKQDELYLQLYGSKAGAQMEPTIEFYEERNNYFTDTTPVIDPNAYGFDSNFNREIAHFIDCLTHGIPCLNPAEDGLELMKILDAIYESAKTGREVIID
ncbi:MAG: Gfo/Idh/MocA family oxidoreductase [Epulopiscium sp.]|nr:Gfo/Idh/MocA family oxidoreductase [Candidatus Epulonipiscium sp.]